ncbi:MBL fold metallo-hydrolase [Amaricoccus tamworthensis]|uniref:MBL fold metallo-hydrolase n=1 Tax=Amaricoccus tamworthensis TaxID=57002 RepID=UPI003C7C8961
MATLTATILGCGSSGGVPRLGGLWGNCDPSNPKNRRQRCSILLDLQEGDAHTRVLVDSSPDMRAQLLAAGVGHLDAVVYTHAHADHLHGIDDLRMIVFNRRSRLPVWADRATSAIMTHNFSYAFIQPEGSSYPPILDLHDIEGPFEITGAAGSIPFTPIPVHHGRIDALGFRVHSLAYMPDVSDLPDSSWDLLRDLDTWILDALRREPHPTHIHLDKALEWIDRAQPRRAVLTNLHNDLDYEVLSAETPDHILAAYDGLEIGIAR